MKNLKPQFIGRRESISTYRLGPFHLHVLNKKDLQRKMERKSRTVFYVAETFSQVTPESAKHGDFSDSGFNDFGSFHSLKEVLARIDDGGFNELNHFVESLNAYQSDSYTVDYGTGTEETCCLHVSGSARNMARLKKILESKSK